MEKKFKTLKNGLGNGLILSYKEYKSDKKLKLKAELTGFSIHEGIETTYKRKRNGCSGDLIGFTGNHNMNDLCVSPHLFPLSHLAKPMRFEGFNAGEEFIFTELWEVGDDDCFMGIDFGNGNAVLIRDLEAISKFDIYHDIKYLPSVVVTLMEFLHLNTEGLGPSEFIDASISKVYEPK